MSALIESVEKYIQVFLRKYLVSDLVFHNLNHTCEVVQAAWEIGQGSDLAKSEMDILIVAAWFHDCGYVNAYIGHEEESKKIAQRFLEEYNADTEFIHSVSACIEATKFPQHPRSIVEKVLCDADLYHFTRPSYPNYAKAIRKEFEVFLGTTYTEDEWKVANCTILLKHCYWTDYGVNVLDPFKQVNVRLMNCDGVKKN